MKERDAEKRVCELSSLNKGQRGRVEHMNLDDGMKRRLQDIGLTEGTTVECVQKSPGGDPKAYLIRGAVMALRAEDAEKGAFNYPPDDYVETIRKGYMQNGIDDSTLTEAVQEIVNEVERNKG